MYESYTIALELCRLINEGSKTEKLKLSDEEIEECVYNLTIRFILFFNPEKSQITTLQVEELVNTFIETHSDYRAMFMKLLKRFLSQAETLEISH